MSTGLDIVHTAGAAQPVGPYSQAIKVNGQIFLSGQIPLTKDGVLIQGSITEKTRLCCENIKAIVEEAGSSVDKIFKVTVLLADMADFDEMNQEYAKFFAHKPSRSCFAVKQLPKGVPVEIECIALA
ncbi:YjgF-like protein [Aspergillus ibericus CBS 121593]|uniref:YjgF-like protein n=1 Tax=Aspergillus ibericus CBS 121593 TaxID=1448316 RepID=A0A395HDR1_9EURO|nr:YjgF-like protein [Aspergillus ibericus CBS 121593]RAL04364.1 YjgF-like protein [Aspergillus ibericus CBS 121593]